MYMFLKEKSHDEQLSINLVGKMFQHTWSFRFFSTLNAREVFECKNNAETKVPKRSKVS